MRLEKFVSIRKAVRFCNLSGLFKGKYNIKKRGKSAIVQSSLAGSLSIFRGKVCDGLENTHSPPLYPHPRFLIIDPRLVIFASCYKSAGSVIITANFCN